MHNDNSYDASVYTKSDDTSKYASNIPKLAAPGTGNGTSQNTNEVGNYFDNSQNNGGFDQNNYDNTYYDNNNYNQGYDYNNDGYNQQ